MYAVTLRGQFWGATCFRLSAELCLGDENIALPCRYILHLSTVQTAATAAEDLREAAHALADLSGLTFSISEADGSASSSTQQQGAQADREASASRVSPADRTGSDKSARDCKRPQALFLAYYNQVSEKMSCCQ